jgi:hypothetical protein
MAIEPCPETIGGETAVPVTDTGDITDGDGNGRSTIDLALEAMVDAAADRLDRGEFESTSYDRCGSTLCTSNAWGVARAVFEAAGVPALVAEVGRLRTAGRAEPAKCNRCGTLVHEPAPPTYATPGQQAAYLAALAKRPHVEYPAVYVAHPEWPSTAEPPWFRPLIDELTTLLPRAIISIPGDLTGDRARLLEEADGLILLPGKDRHISPDLLALVVDTAARGLPVLVHHKAKGTAAWVDCETTETRKVRLPKASEPMLPTLAATLGAMGGAA